MKLSRLETHDRLEYFIKDQQNLIAEGAAACLNINPDSLALQEESPYVYIFAHARTADDGLKKRMLWQPRLSKPEAQENSYLFRATSKTDILEICWTIPPRELWKQYKKGNVTENEYVIWSIDQFLNNKKQLEAPDPRDLNENLMKKIWEKIDGSRKRSKFKMI